MEDNKIFKFKELAEKRVNKAINLIRLVGNLSNSNNYSYSKDDVAKVVTALDDEIQTVKKKFAIELRKKENKFKI
ncbi:hypothetical protein N9410_00885 [Methylophilaceae bacterium]|nr:hypothetical protein [Methylophilaceae bacterium]